MATKPRVVPTDVRAKADERDLQRWQYITKARQRYRIIVQARSEFISNHLRQATAEDYAEWLHGYIARGGEPGYYYDRPLPLNETYVALNDLGDDMPELYGSHAISVIVPAGIKGPNDDGYLAIGHSQIYYMDGYRVSEGCRPPVYSDIQF